MTAVLTLCPDGTVPLAVCEECQALVRVRDLEGHEGWHASLAALLGRLAGLVGDVAALSAPGTGDSGRC